MITDEQLNREIAVLKRDRIYSDPSRYEADDRRMNALCDRISRVPDRSKQEQMHNRLVYELGLKVVRGDDNL